MLLVGFYSSAISVAQDQKLRESIRKFTIGQKALLDSIGSVQMEQEIEKKVVIMTKKYQDTMMQETGLSTSLSDEEVKQYIDDVVLEVERSIKKGKKT